MPMILYAQPKVTRTQRLLAIAQHNEIEMQVASNGDEKPSLSNIPVLDTGKGCVFSTNAIARYLSRIRPDLGLYGQNFNESGEVDSWLEYCSLELEVFLGAWTGSIEKIFPENPEATQRAKQETLVSLQLLNKHLLHWTYLVGENLTVADIHLASILYAPLETHKVLQPLMQDLTNLKRWYSLVAQQDFFKKQFGVSSSIKGFQSQNSSASQGQKPQENKKGNQENKKGNQENKKENGKKNEKKAEGGKKAESKSSDKAADKPAPTAADIKAKKLKAVVKEGGKRGIEISGASDMGGLKFYCTYIKEPDGNLDYMEESMAAMNVECAPDSEERTGCSSYVGKLVVCPAEDNSVLAICAYVPEKIQKEDAIDATMFLEKTLENVRECSNHNEKQYIIKRPSSGKTLAFAALKCDAEVDRYADKLKDVCIAQAIRYLRTRKLFPEDDSDDDDILYGDDVEW